MLRRQPSGEGGVGSAGGGIFKLRRCADPSADSEVVDRIIAARVGAQAHAFGRLRECGNRVPRRCRSAQRGFVFQFGQPPAAAAVHQRRRQRAQRQVSQHIAQARVVGACDLTHAGPRGAHGNGSGRTFAGHAQRQLAGDAVLYEQAVARCCQSRFEYRMCGADAGMAGERYFAARAEHTDAITGVVADRRKDEGGFRQARPFGDGLHRIVAETFGIQHHRQRISGAGTISEDIDLGVAARIHRRGDLVGEGAQSSSRRIA